MGAASIPKSHLLRLGAMWDWGGEYHAFSMRMGEIKKPPGISGGKSRIWAKGQRGGEFRRLKPGVGEPARREQAHRNAERAHRPVPRLGKSRFMVPSWKKNKKNKNRSKKKKKKEIPSPPPPGSSSPASSHQSGRPGTGRCHARSSVTARCRSGERGEQNSPFGYFFSP